MNIYAFVFLGNVFTTCGYDSVCTDTVKKCFLKYNKLSELYQEILDVIEYPNEQMLVDKAPAVQEIQSTVETSAFAESDTKRRNGTETGQSYLYTTLTPTNDTRRQNGLDSTGLTNGMERLKQSMRMVYRGISAEKSARINNTQSIIRLEANVDEELSDLKDETVILSKRLTELSDEVENTVELDNKIQQVNDKFDGINLRMETLSDKLDTVIGIIMSTLKINLALKKSATQSSTYEAGSATRATDGNKDGRWHSGSCTHTHAKARPWWKVDLEYQFVISKVVIINRSDCCGERLHDLKVYVSKTNDGDEALCGEFKGPSTNGATETIQCAPNLKGRYLKIQISTGMLNALTLCEVEVYSIFE